MDHLEMVMVECRSGYRYCERPVAFTWRGERFEVVEVERAWRSCGALEGGRVGHHFRVRTAEGRRFELAHDQSGDAWWLRRPEQDGKTGPGIESA